MKILSQFQKISMDPPASGSHLETGPELKLNLRKCVLCEKLVPRAEETFLEQISEEHNLRSLEEYDTYYETYYTLNGNRGEKEKQNQASVKQEKQILGKSDGGAVESEKVDSGMEEGDSDQELASFIVKKPELVDSSDPFPDAVDVNERSKKPMSSPSKDNQSKVKLEKKVEG